MSHVDDDGIVGFTAAPNGWRVAMGHHGERDVTVVPLVGWAVLREDAPRTEGCAVEPVILWNNVRDPLVSTVAATLDSDKAWFLHQILPPGASVANAPEGYEIRVYDAQ